MTRARPTPKPQAAAWSTKPKVLLAWGVFLILGTLALNASGVVLFSDSESARVPGSVRSNPGAYRTHFFGGK